MVVKASIFEIRNGKNVQKLCASFRVEEIILLWEIRRGKYHISSYPIEIFPSQYINVAKRALAHFKTHDAHVYSWHPHLWDIRINDKWYN